MRSASTFSTFELRAPSPNELTDWQGAAQRKQPVPPRSAKRKIHNSPKKRPRPPFNASDQNNRRGNTSCQFDFAPSVSSDCLLPRKSPQVEILEKFRPVAAEKVHTANSKLINTPIADSAVELSANQQAKTTTELPARAKEETEQKSAEVPGQAAAAAYPNLRNGSNDRELTKITPLPRKRRVVSQQARAMQWLMGGSGNDNDGEKEEKKGAGTDVFVSDSVEGIFDLTYASVRSPVRSPPPPGSVEPWDKPNFASLPWQTQLKLLKRKEAKCGGPPAYSLQGKSHAAQKRDAARRERGRQNTKSKDAPPPKQKLGRVANAAHATDIVIAELEVLKRIALREEVVTSLRATYLALRLNTANLQSEVKIKTPRALSAGGSKLSQRGGGSAPGSLREVHYRDRSEIESRVRKGQCDLSRLIRRARDTGVKVVEGVLEWRNVVRHFDRRRGEDRLRPFEYHGSNYLLQVGSDLAFLDGHDPRDSVPPQNTLSKHYVKAGQLIATWIGFSVADSPLIIPPRGLNVAETIHAQEAAKQAAAKQARDEANKKRAQQWRESISLSHRMGLSSLVSPSVDGGDSDDNSGADEEEGANSLSIFTSHSFGGIAQMDEASERARAAAPSSTRHTASTRSSVAFGSITADPTETSADIPRNRMSLSLRDVGRRISLARKASSVFMLQKHDPPPSTTPSEQIVAQLPLEYEARVLAAARVLEEEYEVDRTLKEEAKEVERRKLFDYDPFESVHDRGGIDGVFASAQAAVDRRRPGGANEIADELRRRQQEGNQLLARQPLNIFVRP